MTPSLSLRLVEQDEVRIDARMALRQTFRYTSGCIALRPRGLMLSLQQLRDAGREKLTQPVSSIPLAPSRPPERETAAACRLTSDRTCPNPLRSSGQSQMM